MKSFAGIFLFLLICSLFPSIRGDFVLENIYEAALDLPRIYFLLRREADGEALESLAYGGFGPHYGYLDTGASGMLFSKETADDLGISIVDGAVFVDTGVGGNQYFDVSEKLYVETTGFTNTYADDPSVYSPAGRWHLQINQGASDPLIGIIDIIGMPVMAGKTVVFYTGGTNNLEYYSGEIYDPNSSAIPASDFEVPIRFEKFITPNSPYNVPPLPAMAYNPVIDNVIVVNGGASSSGTWLFDTGGMVSLISSEQGAALGLVDEYGEPVVETAFTATIGGVGGIAEIPGFEIDSLSLMTTEGYSLQYSNARIAVHDIIYYSEDSGEFKILDGVFGSNFLVASAKLVGGLPVALSQTPFENVILNSRERLLGFDVFDAYEPPVCGDPNHLPGLGDFNGDCYVDVYDLEVFAGCWLSSAGSWGEECGVVDLNSDLTVNLLDWKEFSGAWCDSVFKHVCGDGSNPIVKGDLNRDCETDIEDLLLFAHEWLNDCDWLLFNCRGADENRDGRVDLKDFGVVFENY
jgi:hypothetical protein